MMLVERHVGYLAEVRYRPPLHADELPGFMGGVRGLVADAKMPLVFCTDWREISSFPPDIADTIVWIMRRDNPKIRANGVLVSAEAGDFYQQVHDILRQANNPDRRVFDNPAAVSDWLDPLLSPAERRRRDDFLAGKAPGG